MSFDYTQDADEARELVDEFGRTGTFIKFNATPADALKPWRGPADPDAVPSASHSGVPFVQVSPNEPHLGASRLRSSDLCKDMEAILIVAPGASVTDDLLEFDAVIDGSIRWIILDGEKLQPGLGPPVLYYVAVKK